MTQPASSTPRQPEEPKAGGTIPYGYLCTYLCTCVCREHEQVTHTPRHTSPALVFVALRTHIAALGWESLLSLLLGFPSPSLTTTPAASGCGGALGPLARMIQLPLLPTPVERATLITKADAGKAAPAIPERAMARYVRRMMCSTLRVCARVTCRWWFSLLLLRVAALAALRVSIYPPKIPVNRPPGTCMLVHTFAMEDAFEERRELGTRRRVLLTPMSVLPPSTKRRRRQTQTCECDLKMDDERGPTKHNPRDSSRRSRTRDSSRSGAAAVVRGALAVLLAGGGGLGTGVTAFSAVVSAPPRQRPHHQLISTNAHQQPAPMMVPSPPLLGASTPQTRQFLEDIISGQAAAAAAAEKQEKQKQHQQQQEQERSFGSNSTILGLTDWGGAGAFRLKQEPTTTTAGGGGAAVAVDRGRPAPFPRERAGARPGREERTGKGEGEGDDTGPPRVLRRAAKAAVPAKKAKPKYGYRRSGNK